MPWLIFGFHQLSMVLAIRRACNSELFVVPVTVFVICALEGLLQKKRLLVLPSTFPSITSFFQLNGLISGSLTLMKRRGANASSDTSDVYVRSVLIIFHYMICIEFPENIRCLHLKWSANAVPLLHLGPLPLSSCRLSLFRSSYFFLLHIRVLIRFGAQWCWYYRAWRH